MESFKMMKPLECPYKVSCLTKVAKSLKSPFKWGFFMFVSSASLHFSAQTFNL